MNSMWPQWQTSLDISHLWKKGRIKKQAKVYSGLIKQKANWLHNEGRITGSEFCEIDELTDNLEKVKTVEEFDAVWSEIYDWCDYDKRMWLNVHACFSRKTA